MTTDTLLELTKVLGLPGLFVGALYLLVTRQLNVMSEGFKALAGKIDTHRDDDLESHRRMGEGIARIEGIVAGRRTPAGGVPVTVLGEDR